MSTLDSALFVGLPYAALLLFFSGTIYRYTTTGFQVSSLSSQFLEGRKLFWGVIPFHIGIIVIFFGHLIAFLMPQQLLMWNSYPMRLIFLETVGVAFGMSVFVGLLALIIRRATNPAVRAVSNWMDYAIEILLLSQIALGLWIAIGFRWGSSWFASDLTPYLWSILTFTPDATVVAELPWVIKLHIIGASLIVAIFPFTRLVHILVAPVHYIWRPYQKVVWYWNRRSVRDPDTAWSDARPKNN